jgi:hypothetical protein
LQFAPSHRADANLKGFARLDPLKHVGVGLAGMAGWQAARAADYTLGRFRFLERLLHWTRTALGVKDILHVTGSRHAACRVHFCEQFGWQKAR